MVNYSPYIISKSIYGDTINTCREDRNNKLTTKHERPCLTKIKKQRRDFQALFQDIQFIGHNLNLDRHDLENSTAIHSLFSKNSLKGTWVISILKWNYNSTKVLFWIHKMNVFPSSFRIYQNPKIPWAHSNLNKNRNIKMVRNSPGFKSFVISL